MFFTQLTNAGILTFVLGVALLIVAIILNAVGARAQIKTMFAGVSIPVIILGAILVCSGGEVRVWLTEQVQSALSGGAAVAASVSTAPVRTSNVAPPSSHSAAPSHTNTPSPPAVPPSENATANTSTALRDQSEIFDLGGKVDGHFPDGVAYQLYTIQHGDTIYNIRHRFGLTEAEILNRNDLDIRRPIIVGRTLKIPLP